MQPRVTVDAPLPQTHVSELKTPADEGIAFFESSLPGEEPIRVYELQLDPDGGPSKDRAVSHF
jgi:glycogen debranching enzyme